MAAMTLDEVETKINELLTNPKVDYQIGDKKVSASQYLDQLLKYREQLLKHPVADQATMHFEFDFDEFGDELGEYED